MKLTPWYPGDVKPVREGVYERDYGAAGLLEHRYCYWNGKWWGLYSTLPAGALWFKNKQSTSQNLPWRGVAK